MTGDTGGLLKLVFAPGDRRLLGVHIMGDQSSELIHLGAFVLAGGGTLDSFVGAVYNYPTLSDAYRAAAHDGLERLKRLASPG
jgi:NAD(P) transhydrogenase